MLSTVARMLLPLLKRLGLVCLMHFLTLSDHATATAYVKVPFTSHSRPTHRTKRQTVTLQASNAQHVYLANVTLGTPPQSFQVTLDTGSSDLWVPTTNSSLCTQNPSLCAKTGQYDLSKSTTAHSLGTLFNESYGDTSGSTGIFVTDTIALGNASLPSLQFGAADDVLKPVHDDLGLDTHGVLGLADPQYEGVASRGGTTYPNLIAQMKDTGLIKAMGYSLYFDQQSATAGEVLFGGVDTGKFDGALVALPMVQSAGVQALEVQMTALYIGDSVVDDSFAIPTVLDSGSSAVQLVPTLSDAIFRYTGAENNPGAPSEGMVPCNLSSANANFTITLGGPAGVNISLPLSQLVLSFNGQAQYSDGTEACELAVRESSIPSLNILGAAFLRNVYVVYNLDAKMIGVAQARFGAGTGEVVPIEPDGIPGAKATASLLPTGNGDLPTSAPTNGGYFGPSALAMTRVTGKYAVQPSPASVSALSGPAPIPTIFQSGLPTSPVTSGPTERSTGTQTGKETGPSQTASGSVSTSSSQAGAGAKGLNVKLVGRGLGLTGLAMLFL